MKIFKDVRLNNILIQSVNKHLKEEYELDLEKPDLKLIKSEEDG
jgi:hypothetical protein